MTAKLASLPVSLLPVTVVLSASPPMMSPTDREEAREEQEHDEDILVACRCESARAVATLLHCLRHVAASASSGGSSAAQMGGGGTTGGGDAAAYSQGHKRSAANKKSSSTSAGASASALQPVTVFCSPSSLTFHVHGRAKQMQASVDLQKGLFSHYRVVAAPPPPDGEERPTGGNEDGPDGAWQGGAGGEFCVNLAKVLECLHVLGGAASSALDRTVLSFTYNAATEIFCMELLEHDTGMLISAAIPGMIPPDDDDLGNSLALAFRSSPLAARIIVRSDTLREMVQELELVAGATHATVSLGPAGLEMAAVGHLGECVVSVPPKGPHVVSLEAHPVAAAGNPSAARSYPLHSLLASMRGLEIAQETCLTVNAAGMMAIQHQVVDAVVGDGNPNFVDFILCCMEDEIEEDDSAGAAVPSRSPRTTRRDDADADAGVTSPETAATNDGTRTAASGGRSRRGGRRESDDDSTSSDEENDDGRSMQSSLPLFGSVVNSASASLTASSPEAESSVRGVLHDQQEGDDDDADEPSPDTRWNGHKRRRRDRSFASSSRQRRRDLPKARPARLTRATEQVWIPRGGEGDDSSSSSNPMGGHEEGGHENEVAGSQPMDVTDFSRSPVQRRPAGTSRVGDRDGDCSSPELVYGRIE